MGKKSRKNKKNKNIIEYSKLERLNNINIIKNKIIDLGLGIYEEIKKLFIIMNIFIENGEKYFNTIKLIDCNKKIIIFLNNNKKHEIYVKIEDL